MAVAANARFDGGGAEVSSLTSVNFPLHAALSKTPPVGPARDVTTLANESSASRFCSNQSTIFESATVCREKVPPSPCRPRADSLITIRVDRTWRKEAGGCAATSEVIPGGRETNSATPPLTAPPAGDLREPAAKPLGGP